mgnify:CR=1 FL=1
MLAGFPIVFLLLFVYVFGGQLGTDSTCSAATTGRAARTSTYVVPGILIMTVASAVLGTAISVAMRHDRRHHRPVPHHGHRPRRRPHRPRDRQPAADPAPSSSSCIGVSPRASASGSTADPLDWLAAIGLLALVRASR